MKKNNNYGFMLVETLVVSVFVATTLTYLYVKFTNLNASYSLSFSYNTVEDLYALDDIRTYLLNYEDVINNELESVNYIDSVCMLLPDKNYCTDLLKAERINRLVIAKNDVSTTKFPKNYDQDFIDFIEKINAVGSEKYRLIASFDNSTFATVRF